MWVALLHGVIRQDCVDKGMTSKERPERNWGETNQGTENSKEVTVTRMESVVAYGGEEGGRGGGTGRGYGGLVGGRGEKERI